MFGILILWVLVIFFFVNVIVQVFMGLILLVISMLDFYRVMRGMSKRIFFIYYEF